MYPVRGKQRTAGVSRPPPPPGTTVTLINGDLNTQVTQPGPADHLSGGVSHQRLLLSTPAHHMQGVGGSTAYVTASGSVCVCVGGFQSADGNFPLWSSSVL